jgi:Flp pilus assembly protein TadG
MEGTIILPQRPRSRFRRGQALVELVLAMPVLVGVLALIVEGTLTVSASHSLQDAVHQATRVASREKVTDKGIRNRIAAIVANDPLAAPEDLSIKVKYGIDSNGAKNIRVRAKLPVRPIAFTNLGTFHLSAEATYRVARDEEDPS